MRSGWKRFAAFMGTVGALIALVIVATRNEPTTSGLLIAEVVLIGGLSYLLTFLFWPRRAPHVSRAHPSHRSSARPVPEEPRSRIRDPRPVLVIGERPAGSRPGSKVHFRDTPTLRSARGRRPGPRPQSEIRWPAQR